MADGVGLYGVDLKVHAVPLDFGRTVGVAFEYEGKRTAIRVPNPYWPEINRKWHEAHPQSLPCATPNCEYCKC